MTARNDDPGRVPPTAVPDPDRRIPTTATLWQVPVDGGMLTVGDWPGDGPPDDLTGDNAAPDVPVVAIHGITSHHGAFRPLAEAVSGRRVLAPDLRGRGRSRDLPGPWGMARHADDIADAVRALAGAGPVDLVGHSMGGFVSVVLAQRHPDLVRGIVLVDGGLPFAPEELETTRAGLDLIRQRLQTPFPSADAYVEIFHQHPAFAHDWQDAVADYARYDTVALDGATRARADVEAVIADQTELIDTTVVQDALAVLHHPTVFLHAGRGFVDDPPGLYAAPTVESLQAEYPAIDMRFVDGVNHYTIGLSGHGSAAIVAALDSLGSA